MIFNNKKKKSKSEDKSFIDGPFWLFKMLFNDQKMLVKRPRADVDAGNYEDLHPWLLDLVADAKTEQRIKYLRSDAYTAIDSLSKLAKNLNDYQHGRQSKYVSTKYMDKIIKKGMTVAKIKKHIDWLKGTYIPAINKRAAEIRKESKSKNESAILYGGSIELL